MKHKRYAKQMVQKEKEGKDTFYCVEPPLEKEPDDFAEKIVFKKGRKDEVIVELKYDRVPCKTVSLSNISKEEINKFEELCSNISLGITLNSCLAATAIAYNLTYIKTRAKKSKDNASKRLDISEAFNKEYYDNDLRISAESFTNGMVQYFDIISETDTEITLTFKK